MYNRNEIFNFKIVNKINQFSRKSMSHRYKNYNINYLTYLNLKLLILFNGNYSIVNI